MITATSDLIARNELIRISIVTITYNDHDGLKLTQESVHDLIGNASSEEYWFEWVVIDGGSDIFEQHQFLYEIVKSTATVFVSEADNGIYHAMNKGIECSSGDYLWFLNSGDTAVNAFLQAGLAGLPALDAPDMIWGRAKYRMPGGEIIDVKSRDASFIRYSNPVCHQAVLFSAEILKGERFNEKYVSAGDYELIARLVKKKCSIVQSEYTFCISDSVGASNRDIWLQMRECNRVRRDVLGLNWLTANFIGVVKSVYICVSNWFPIVRKYYRKQVLHD